MIRAAVEFEFLHQMTIDLRQAWKMADASYRGL